MQDAHAAIPAPVTLDPQRLEVYAVALDFHACAAGLVPKHGQAHLRDQLARASLSIVLNIAEARAGFHGPIRDASTGWRAAAPASAARSSM